jgi:hypothetical protein
MTNYPTSLDTVSNLPTSYVPTNDFTATAANTMDSAILALETKVGIGSTTPTTAGQVLTTTGAGASAWQSPAAASNATSGTPGIIQLAGDLGGSATSPTVAKIQGVTISGTPQNNYMLMGTSPTAASWQPMYQVPPNVVTGTYAASFAINCATTTILRLVLTGNPTFTVTGTPYDGQELTLRLVQDAVGSRTVTFNGSYFSFGSGSAPTLTTTANKTDILGFVYNAAAGLWDYYGIQPGF